MSNLSDTIEPKTKEFLDRANSAKGPALHELSPEDARKVIDGLQGDLVQKAAAHIEERTIQGGPGGDVSFRIVRPEGAKGALLQTVWREALPDCESNEVAVCLCEEMSDRQVAFGTPFVT